MQLPGKAIRTKLSNQTWGNSKLLILTHKKEEEQINRKEKELISLWSFTERLEPKLLLEDYKK